MCGRFGLFTPPEDLSERFGADLTFDYEPRYNIAPRDDVATIRNVDEEHIVEQEWSLLPHWAEDTDEEPRPINARSETVAEKPMFEEAFKERRCLVLTDGFYEWKGERGNKQPFRVHLADDEPFAMAGIWNRFEANGEALETVTILTTEPNEVIEPIHDRMPVVLERDDEDTWLAGAPDQALAACGPYEGSDMAAYEVSTALNNPENDGAEVILPADTEQSGIEEF